VRSIIEAVAPKRLGAGFRWLLASSWSSNAGDGIAMAAGPLLVASLTHDAVLIALAATLQWLPPLLFALVAGTLSDRVDRRLIVVTVDGLRAVMLAVLSLAVATGVASIPLVLATLFALATAEVFADNTTATLLPMLVHRDDLALANSRLQVGFVTVNQLAGPPVGAALFTVGAAVPFVAQAVLVAFGALLVSRLALPTAVRSTSPVWHDVVEGFRWVRHHAAVRTLALTIFIFNITFGAAWSVLVLYATRHLGLGAVGFGLVTTVSALGGLTGTLLYSRITARISLGDIMRIGLIIETLTHFALAITTQPAVALCIFFVFGAHALIWGTTSTTIRQRAVPTMLQGRVTSVYAMGVYGGLVLGSAVGGVLADAGGVTAPFWFAFAGSALFVVLIWRQLTHIAHDEPAVAPA
jgi:MFS family permease